MREKFQTIETFEKEYGVHFTKKHNGKMTGFMSISTSPTMNTFCQFRSQCEGSICQKCYAVRMMDQYKLLDRALIKNYEVLTSQIIPVEKMPLLNCLMFRFESFGDIQNEIQIINYFNLCKRNPRVQFTIWTKNMGVYKRLFENGYNGVKYSKPKNLILIVSSPMINTALKIEDFPFADKVFTVYDKEYIKANDIKINCGAKSCMTCQRCYSKNKVVYINEKMK